LYRAAAKLRELKVPSSPRGKDEDDKNQAWNVQNLASLLRNY